MIFPKTVLNDIRERVSIVGLIGERVQLKRAGRTFKGRCPFHNEKTPSFNVSDDKAFYHCFGCGEGGDIFDFMMKFDGLSFTEAVRYLAERSGVKLPDKISAEDVAKEDAATRKKKLLLRVNEIARDHYVSRLFDNKAGARAREYLQLREISSEFFTQLFLGYADNSWDALVRHLQEKNVPLELAFELGLIKKRDTGGYYDFFRDRLMFPIVSVRNEVLGFSGRDLSGEENVAKYVNSPDSGVYHKSSVVFGLHNAQTAIRNLNSVILVEGNIDLVSLQQRGILNSVAPLGTALTEGHVRTLARYTRNQIVMFDGDAAGEKAAIRALEIFIGEGISPRVVPMPKGEDPDSLIRKEGAEKFGERIKNARSLFEYFVDRVAAKEGSDASGKIAALSQIAPMLKLVTEPSDKAVYARYVSRRLDLDESTVGQAVRKVKEGRAGQEVKGTSPVATKSPDAAPTSPIEKKLIELMLIRPDLAVEILEDISGEEFRGEWAKKVVDAIKLNIAQSGKLNLGDMIKEVEDSDLALKIRQIAFAPEKFSDEEVKELKKDLVGEMKKRDSRSRMDLINEDIRSAEAGRDEPELMKLLEEKKRLAGELKRH